MPKVIKKRQTSAAGLLLELIGFAMLSFWNVNPILSMIGVGLLIAGISMANKFVCSECGNKIEDKNVKMCPVCKARFDTKQDTKSQR
jgi:rubrerythrin